MLIRQGTIWRYVIPLSAILVWHVVATLGALPVFLPSPGAVLGETFLEFASGEILPDIAATLSRVLASYLAAIPLGISIGLAMGASRPLHHGLEFIVDFFRSIPATALFPLFLFFFGIGNEAKVAAGIWAASLIIIVNTTYGVRHAGKLRIMVAKSMKVGRLKLFRDVIFPEALPHIFAGLRIALSITVVVIVVTEMFIGTNIGLGHRIMDAQLVYRVPEMYAAIIVTGIIGYILNKSLLMIERTAVHWSGK